MRSTHRVVKKWAEQHVGYQKACRAPPRNFPYAVTRAAEECVERHRLRQAALQNFKTEQDIYVLGVRMVVATMPSLVLLLFAIWVLL